MHNSFFGKAAQPTFQTRNEIHRHFAIFGRTIRIKIGSFKIDISTHITSVKMIVLKIIGQAVAL